MNGVLAFGSCCVLCALALYVLAVRPGRGAMARLVELWGAPEAGETARTVADLRQPQDGVPSPTEGTAAPARGVIDLEAYRRRRMMRVVEGGAA